MIMFHLESLDIDNPQLPSCTGADGNPYLSTTPCICLLPLPPPCSFCIGGGGLGLGLGLGLGFRVRLEERKGSHFKMNHAMDIFTKGLKHIPKT